MRGRNEVIVETKTYQINQISDLVKDLKAGHVVAVATDTVMGLAVRADLLLAFERLKKVKGRPDNKPFPVMVANLNQLENIVDLSDKDIQLATLWFPGAITFILNKKQGGAVVSSGKTLAVRIPDDNLLREIVSRLDAPIFLTSANKSGQPTTMLASEVLDIFNGEIKSVLLKDALGYQASSIVDLTKEPLNIVREGSISLEMILESLER